MLLWGIAIFSLLIFLLTASTLNLDQGSSMVSVSLPLDRLPTRTFVTDDLPWCINYLLTQLHGSPSIAPYLGLQVLQNLGPLYLDILLHSPRCNFVLNLPRIPSSESLLFILTSQCDSAHIVTSSYQILPYTIPGSSSSSTKPSFVTEITSLFYNHLYCLI